MTQRQSSMDMISTANARSQSGVILPSEEHRVHRLRRNVFLVETEDMGRILDFERGQFFGLGLQSLRKLLLVLHEGLETAADRIAAQHRIDVSQVRDDLQRFMEQLAQRQLIEDSRPAEKQRPLSRQIPRAATRGLWRRPARAAAGMLLFIGRGFVRRLRRRVRRTGQLTPPGRSFVWVMLAVSWVSLRVFGWTGTLQRFRRWQEENDPPVTDAVPSIIHTVDEMVRQRSARSLFLPMVCKERAMAAYQILRAVYGLPASILLGYERFPFCAHAWVSCAGVTVTDDPDRCEQFVPVVEYR